MELVVQTFPASHSEPGDDFAKGHPEQTGSAKDWRVAADVKRGHAIFVAADVRRLKQKSKGRTESGERRAGSLRWRKGDFDCRGMRLCLKCISILLNMTHQVEFSRYLFLFSAGCLITAFNSATL